MIQKSQLRQALRARRRVEARALPERVRALVLLRPPAAIARLAEAADIIGLYHATASEAPARGYARWFHEQGKRLALPWFADRAAPMRFRAWHDPFDDDDLEPGPWGALQPSAAAAVCEPDLLFVPLLGFTADGHRLGQGGGHYDRWLAAHDIPAVGLAWDCQLCERLPLEAHDRPLTAVVTPTRIYGSAA